MAHTPLAKFLASNEQTVALMEASQIEDENADVFIGPTREGAIALRIPGTLVDTIMSVERLRRVRDVMTRWLVEVAGDPR